MDGWICSDVCSEFGRIGLTPKTKKEGTRKVRVDRWKRGSLPEGRPRERGAKHAPESRKEGSSSLLPHSTSPISISPEPKTADIPRTPDAWGGDPLPSLACASLHAHFFTFFTSAHTCTEHFRYTLSIFQTLADTQHYSGKCHIRTIFFPPPIPEERICFLQPVVRENQHYLAHMS